MCATHYTNLANSFCFFEREWSPYVILFSGFHVISGLLPNLWLTWHFGCYHLREASLLALEPSSASTPFIKGNEESKTEEDYSQVVLALKFIGPMPKSALHNGC